MAINARSPLEQLRELEPTAERTRALAFYDSLPPASIDMMIGRWRGGEIATGHVFDGLLGPAGWYGKAFRSADDVDPLLFRRPHGGLVAGNPALMPMGLIARMPRLAKHPVSAALFRASIPLLATRRPRARLRMTDYRGQSSATMIYDHLPINDVFRKVDEDTLLGAMDIRGHPEPFFFTLRREKA